jgi:hypothetical protein
MRRPALAGACHGLSCLAAAGGRLLQSADAQAEPRPAASAALLLLCGIGLISGPERSSGLGHRRDWIARRHHAAADSRTIAFPSNLAIQSLLGLPRFR